MVCCSLAGTAACDVCANRPSMFASSTTFTPAPMVTYVPERTCHLIHGGQGWWECDSCGGSIDWDSCDPNDPPACNYCPNCGAKVV